MSTLDDLIAAKDELSRRILRARRKKADIRAAITAKDARAAAGRNLHAIGVGRKLVGGKQTRTLCVRLYVAQKLPSSMLPADARLPKRIAGFPTDVIEAPVARAHALQCTVKKRDRQRPLIGGISAAHQAVLRATLGCFCHSTVWSERGRPFMLGTNHAFANTNAGTRGNLVLQPSSGDGGTPGSVVGSLARFKQLAMGSSYAQNRVDAAIAAVAPKIKVRNEVCTIGALRGVASAELDMIVCKHGRTTGYTEGRVVDVSSDAVVIDYPGGNFATFVNQLRVDPTVGYAAPPDEVQWDGWFAAPGDSGSVLVDKKTRKAVGLHFAGEYGISLANHMRDVCHALRIAIP